MTFPASGVAMTVGVLVAVLAQRIMVPVGVLVRAVVPCRRVLVVHAALHEEHHQRAAGRETHEHEGADRHTQSHEPDDHDHSGDGVQRDLLRN